MSKKTAVVTGASKGIGLAIAKELCQRGYEVYGSYVSRYSEEEIGALEEDGFHLLKADVSVPEEAQLLVDKVLAEHGSLDVLVNNAGITKDNLLLRMTAEDFSRVLDVNLTGAFNTVKAATKPMMKQRAGRIVNITSVVGLTGNAGQANYAASKAGLIGFSKSVAKELASRNVTVNCVAPGFIRTDMTDVLKDEIKESIRKDIPLGRFGEPSEIAKVVAFLVSDDAAYITGQVVNVSGGLVV